MAWIYQARKRGNWYLASSANGQRTHRTLKTANRRTAERELARVNAEERKQPLVSGRIRWSRQDWQRFANMRGQTRVARQGYALATRAIRALAGDPRFAYLLAPVPRIVTLAELGRLDPALITIAALEICERQLSSKAALAFIRSARGVHRRARPRTLADAIRRAVRCHCERHPETAPAEIALQLRAVALDFEQRTGRTPPA
jgi:hypothetical protein